MKSRILLVEDDEFVSAVVRGILSHAGFAVWICDSLEKVKMLDPFDFAAVMTDFQLPGANGCDVVEYARSRSPQIAALMVSGDGDSMMTIAADRGLTDVGFLDKPFRPHELIEKLSDVLRIAAYDKYEPAKGSTPTCS